MLGSNVNTAVLGSTQENTAGTPITLFTKKCTEVSGRNVNKLKSVAQVVPVRLDTLDALQCTENVVFLATDT